MKKYKNLIIWIVVLVLIFSAAYVIYDKYKSQIMLQAPVPGSLAGSGNESDTDGTGNSNGTGSGNGSGNDSDSDDAVIMVPDFTLKDLEGNEVSLSDYRGKIVVLNF